MQHRCLSLLSRSLIFFTIWGLPAQKANPVLHEINRCLTNTLAAAKDVTLQQKVTMFVEHIDPKLKRINEFKRRFVVAQQEAAAYAAKKGATLPVISFYIPVYNRAHVVKDAIDSIYRQELSVPFEVVAVDDASTDATYQTLLDYEKRYPNFFVYRHANNKQAPAARNTAILHCRGAFLFGLDSDDILLKKTAETALHIARQQKADVVLFGEYRYFFDNHPQKIARIGRGSKTRGWGTVAECLACNKIPFTCGCKLFTRESALNTGGYIEAAGHDTWTFNYLQLARGCRVLIVPQCGYLHRCWRNGHCYTKQSVVHNWSQSPSLAINEYRELLTHSSSKRLQKRRIDNTFFLEQMARLKISKDGITTLLQNGFYAYDRQKYNDAVNFIIKAINAGATDPHVYSFLLDSAVRSERYADARKALNYFLNGQQ